MHEALNHAKLAMLFRKEFELCNVRKGETIVLLSDLGARRDYVAAAFAAAEDFGADAYEMCVNAMPSWTKVGVETVGRCKGTLEAIKAADLLVCLHIPLFTRWLKEARDAGTRVLMVIDDPDEVRLDVRDGFIRNIEGALDAKLMSDWLDGNKAHSDDMDGHAISHLGWGLNPQGRWDAIALNGPDPKRHHAGARCFAGNFLFSTGPNSQGGGKRTTKGHYDVPMRDCTVALDNDVIIDRGKFTDPKMQVAFVPR